MFFLRLTLYTCAFYFAIALPIIIAELAVEFWTKDGIFGIHFSGRVGIAAFIGFWGLIWLGSFLLAFHKSFPFIWARLIG